MEPVQENIKAALEFLRQQIISELRGQGHVATGNLLRSIEIVIEELGEKIVGRILVADYALFLDKGVSADRIPFSGITGRGGKSRYIQALINWIRIKRPSASDNQVKGIAFAIAHKAKQEGHPTRGSYAYAQNNRRKEWTRYAIDDNEEEFEKLLDLENLMVARIENLISNSIKFAA